MTLPDWGDARTQFVQSEHAHVIVTRQARCRAISPIGCMELLALFAVAVAAVIGWLICAVILTRTVSAEDRIYFAPAVGLTVCGVVAYLAVRLNLSSLLRPLCIISVAVAGWCYWRSRRSAVRSPHEPRLAVFTFGVVLLVYAMEIALYGLFSRVHPGQHEVW
ncbi:MAG: hypothetical protein M3Y69_06785, partial [Verrucomicrobiota bacterium]|nr:hypothetical protein [Verrucomicrobiota bacterium]